MNSIIKAAGRTNLKTLGARAAVAVTGMAVAALAHADEGTDAIAALEVTAASYISAAFGVAILVAGGFWGIRMMKKAFGAAK